MSSIYIESSRLSGDYNYTLECECGFDGYVENYDETFDKLVCWCPRCGDEHIINYDDLEELVVD